MARTAVATCQAVWDCRWSRPGIRLASIGEREQPDAAWTCVRTPEHRPVTDAECATCPHWEMEAPR